MKRSQIYKCDDCSAMIEVLNDNDCAGELTCGGKPFRLLSANTQDAAEEKHVPVVEKTGEGFKVKVGSTEHPMTPEHWIEWIEVSTPDGKSYKKFLTPDDKPEAVFKIDADKVTAREHCNIHGLWKG